MAQQATTQGGTRRRPSKGLATIDELMKATDEHEALKARDAGLREVRRIQVAMHQLEESTGGESVADLLEQIVRTASISTLTPTASLTEEQEEVLRDTGSLVTAMPSLSQRPSTRTALRRAQIMADSLTIADVAERLAVSESRVRQRIGERSLIAIRTPAGVRLPRFQFFRDAELPGWDEVAPHFPSDAHPVAIQVFLATATSELDIAGDPTSPYDWLADGGRPARVAELVDSSYELP